MLFELMTGSTFVSGVDGYGDADFDGPTAAVHWGTPLTTSFTSNVFYGYPAGMNIVPISKVVVPPIPK